MRHGLAEAGTPDPGLTPDGLEAVDAVLGALQLEGSGIGMLAHSPLRRARETADASLARFPVEQRLELDELLPDTPAGVAGETLAALTETRVTDADRMADLVVVSHLPLLPGLAHWLCGETLAFDPASAWLCHADTFWQQMGTPLRDLHAADLAG